MRYLPYTAVAYTTHGHTSENPRARFIFPMTRDVSAEEYAAVARYLAQMLGIDYFDECSYLPNQLMFWPSSPSNGEYLCLETDKDWLNPDDILSAHPEWTDPTQLPTSSRETTAKDTAVKKVEDPLDKKGVVGLFNRAYYPVHLALAEFLSDVYEPTSIENRYHLIESSSMPGVEIKEDKFVYSHHAKDPAYLKLCNAFDIVRLHKFGDDKASFNAMCDFVMKQDKVKLLALEEKQAQLDEDFVSDDEGDKDWQKKLVYQSKSEVLENSVWNLMLILTNDPDFSNIAFNEMAGRIEVTGKVPWERPIDNFFWRDADMAQMKALIDIRYGVFSTRNYDVAFTKVVEDRHFHPVREYFKSLPEWDKVPRVESLLIDYFGAEDTSYTKAVTRKTMIEFNKAGAERKALVTAIGEILGTKPKYMGMPTMAYDFGGLIIDKNGGAEFEENIFPKDITDLLQKLADRGFTAENSEELEQVEEIAEEPEETPQGENVGLTVAIPLEKVGVGNLTNLLDAKGYLIKKALGVEDIRIEIDEEKVSFPWFSELPDADTCRAYQNFIAALCKMGKEQKRINATEKPVDNEKYAFRCFLLRLGFIGAEYKTDRKILLNNLDGSSAFKSGAKKEAESNEISE